MIPVEKIAGGTLGNLLYYVSIIGVLLVICTIIRLKVSFLRKAFIPASLLAGIIGMILGPHVLGVIPADMMSSIGAIPSHMITIVFACMMLGVKKSENTSSMMHDAAAGLGWLWSNSFMQVGVACLLCAFLFTPVFGVNELFGSLFEIGFAGGHGTAGGMASVFTDSFNWADGADLGKTTATIGLLAGIFGGMAIINIAVRKKWTKVLTEPASGNAAKEVFDEGDPNHEPSAYATISQYVQGMALEILVTCAMASISIPVVLAYWAPLLIGTVVIMVFMVFWTLWLSPRIFNDCWFEQAIIRYGAFCGVAAVGYMLLRSADPKMETDAGTIYALDGPLMSPFIGGGLVTSMWPFLITSMGAMKFGFIACGISLAILVVLRLFFWKKDFKMQQR